MSKQYLTANGMKYLKLLHILLVIMWTGGAMALCLIAAVVSTDTGGGLITRSLILKVIDDYLIIPGAIGCLITGLIYGIWTRWGLIKHKWVAVKLVLSIAQILFGTFVLGPWVNGNVLISGAIGVLALADPVFNSNMHNTLIWGPVQLFFLLFMVVISIFKPWKAAK